MSNDNSHIKVSVLIPVYGVEKYIERCARSLFEQTMREGIEFIFTDDCTPDGSIAILEKVLNDYPERKPQVRIIHHDTNKGLAVARVTGVNAARGEYVIHCDSDDWVEPDMYELMYAKAKETDADIVGCDFYEEDGKKPIPIKQNFSLNSKQSVIAILLGQRTLDSYLWCRLIKRSFYIKNNFAAAPNISLLEDMAISIPMHLATHKVSYIPQPLYHYRMVNESITHTVSLKHIYSSLTVIKGLKQYVTGDNELYDAWELAYYRNAQFLITQPSTYEPDRWLSETAEIRQPYYGSWRNRISPWLIRHHLNRINRFIITLYRY